MQLSHLVSPLGSVSCSTYPLAEGVVGSLDKGWVGAGYIEEDLHGNIFYQTTNGQGDLEHSENVDSLFPNRLPFEGVIFFNVGSILWEYAQNWVST